MSYCSIYIIDKDGSAREYRMFSNSWGGAARIWSALWDHYVRDPNKEYDSWMHGDQNKLWDLPKSLVQKGCITPAIVLISTFDRAIVKREKLSDFTAALRQFDKQYPVEFDTANHLPTWADTIDEIAIKEPECIGIGFFQTSVAEDLWYEEDQDTGEAIPYNVLSDNRHFSVYKHLDDLLDNV